MSADESSTYQTVQNALVASHLEWSNYLYHREENGDWVTDIVRALIMTCGPDVGYVESAITPLDEGTAAHVVAFTPRRVVEVRTGSGRSGLDRSINIYSRRTLSDLDLDGFEADFDGVEPAIISVELTAHYGDREPVQIGHNLARRVGAHLQRQQNLLGELYRSLLADLER